MTLFWYIWSEFGKKNYKVDFLYFFISVCIACQKTHKNHVWTQDNQIYHSWILWGFVGIIYNPRIYNDRRYMAHQSNHQTPPVFLRVFWMARSCAAPAPAPATLPSALCFNLGFFRCFAAWNMFFFSGNLEGFPCFYRVEHGKCMQFQDLSQHWSNNKCPSRTWFMSSE